MRSFKSQLLSKLSVRGDEVDTLTRRDQATRREEWKRDLTGRPSNGTIDSWVRLYFSRRMRRCLIDLIVWLSASGRIH